MKRIVARGKPKILKTVSTPAKKATKKLVQLQRRIISRCREKASAPKITAAATSKTKSPSKAKKTTGTKEVPTKKAPKPKTAKSAARTKLIIPLKRMRCTIKL